MALCLRGSVVKSYDLAASSIQHQKKRAEARFVDR